MTRKTLVVVLGLAFLAGCGTDDVESGDMGVKPPINPATAEKVVPGDRANLNGVVCAVTSTVPVDGSWYVAVAGANWGTGIGWLPLVAFDTIESTNQGYGYRVAMYGGPSQDRQNMMWRTNEVVSNPKRGEEFSAPVRHQSDGARARILICRGGWR